MNNKNLNDLINYKDEELLELLDNSNAYKGDFIIRVKQEINLRKELVELSNPAKHSERYFKPLKKKNYLKWSLKALVICSLISLVSYCIFKDPYAEYTMQTKGTVHELVELTTYSQGFKGMTHVLIGYTAKYTYKVDGVSYGGQMLLENNAKNSKYIKEIKKHLGHKKYIIRYKVNEHDSSILDIEKIDLNEYD